MFDDGYLLLEVKKIPDTRHQTSNKKIIGHPTSNIYQKTKKMKRITYTLLYILLFTINVVAQETIYSESFNRHINEKETVSKVFSISSSNISSVSLQLKGFDEINDNILPVISIKINNKNVFTGTLSDFSYGKNNQYGEIEFNIANFTKIGNNTLTIQYEGIAPNSYVFIRNINIIQKIRGESNKTLKDFNYDKKLYTEYLKKNLPLESDIVATENYQLITRGMIGVYYGEFPYNSRFCSVKWSKKLNANVTVSAQFPEEYKAYAYNIPYSSLKIKKTNNVEDNKPPIIVSSIDNYAKVKSKTINISGRATDQGGIYAVFINDIKAEINNQGYYTLNLPLDIGSNNVKIVAFDKYGNKDLKNITVIRHKNENDLPPFLDISYPAQKNISVGSNSMHIIGKASDDTYVSYIQVIANKNVYKVFVENNKEFKIHLTLMKGVNNVKLTAFDELGNKSNEKDYKISFEPENSKPVIRLTEPTGLVNNILKIDKTLENLPISVEISSLYPVSDVSVIYINTPVTEPLSNTQNTQFKGNIKLPLAPEIEISILAKDVHGTESMPLSFKIERNQEADPFPDIDQAPVTGKRCNDCYALVIGNANYDENKSLFNSLPYAKNDAKVFKDYLVNTLGVPALNVTYVEDNKTMDFLNTINNFVKKISSKKNGKYLFYYTGHGALDKNQAPYLVPTDYNEANDVYGIINGLIIDSIVYKMLYAEPEKLTVILDMCYSGKEAKGVQVGDVSYSYDGPVVVFTAAEKEAFPFKRRNHSLFTYAFLKVLNEAKGDINYEDLADETQQTMQRIINHENIPIEQNMTISPSSILDDDWKTWELP